MSARGDAQTQLNYGRLAGWLFIGGALLGLPSSVLMEPPAPLSYTVLTVLGVVTGTICLYLPWESYPRWVFHVVAIVATLEAVMVIRLFDPLYVLFYFLIAVYVAYIYPDWRQVVPHVCFLAFALFLPLIYDPDNARATMRLALFSLPVLVIAAAMVAYLRARVEEHARIVAQLAGETSRIATQIRRAAGADER